MEDKLYTDGEILFDTDVPLSEAFFILEGEVSLELTLGEKTVTIEIGTNHFVGDAAVAVDPLPDAEPLVYHGRAIAVGNVKAVSISVDDIKAELDACPPLLRAWIASFTSRILQVIDKLSKP
jgi:CRP-like cAMP-binding protein